MRPTPAPHPTCRDPAPFPLPTPAPHAPRPALPPAPSPAPIRRPLGYRYVINMTLPDKEEDYVHRVGRVGRADVMGLAISLVSRADLEKVWYYDKRRWEGKTLSTKLAADGGCCIWCAPPLTDGRRWHLWRW